MEVAQKRCSGFAIWYKLYANDLVVTVSHQHLEQFLTILHQFSHECDLIINPKKRGILAIKKTARSINTYSILKNFSFL
jgi:hypothetical protein